MDPHLQTSRWSVRSSGRACRPVRIRRPACGRCWRSSGPWGSRPLTRSARSPTRRSSSGSIGRSRSSPTSTAWPPCSRAQLGPHSLLIILPKLADILTECYVNAPSEQATSNRVSADSSQGRLLAEEVPVCRNGITLGVTNPEGCNLGSIVLRFIRYLEAETFGLFVPYQEPAAQIAVFRKVLPKAA